MFLCGWESSSYNLKSSIHPSIVLCVYCFIIIIILCGVCMHAFVCGHIYKNLLLFNMYKYVHTHTHTHTHIYTDLYTHKHPHTHTTINFWCSAVPFLATEAVNFMFLVCALHPLVFNWSFPKLHQIFMGPLSRPKHIFDTDCHRLGGQLHLFLGALYRAEFSTDLQINIKNSLDQNLDSNLFSSLISYICGH